jgi:hypothetical protein
MVAPNNAGNGGRIDSAPAPGARFRADGQGTLAVSALIAIADDRHRPRSFLVRADDGSFWSLVPCPPAPDGLAYAGTQIRSA